MPKLSISVAPSTLAFVDQQVAALGHASRSEYVRSLIRREQDRERLRAQVLAGAAAPVVAMADARYFGELRRRIAR